jgi:hypothetical protein
MKHERKPPYVRVLGTVLQRIDYTLAKVPGRAVGAVHYS